MPLPDLGVVDVERNLFEPFYSSLPLGPFSSSPFKHPGRIGGWRCSTASSADVTARLFYFLTFPAVGCMFDDDAIRDAIRVLFYNQGRPGSLRSAASGLYVAQMRSKGCPALPLESQMN